MTGNSGDFSGQPSLTAVLVPMTRGELPALFRLFFIWGGYAQLSARAVSCRLIVTLDCPYDEEIEARIKSRFELFGLPAVFESVEVGFCGIPPEENIYVRSGQESPANIPPLGLKNGPNVQFFSSLLDFCPDEDVVLLNEVDCFPATKDWLPRLSRLAQGSEPFWILGSPYRGYGKLGPDIIAHINGNALYGIGTDGFRDVLMKHWHEGLTNAVVGNPGLAYDVFLDHASHEMRNPRTWKNVSLEKFRFYSSLLCKVRHTDLIHNLAGSAELSGLVKIDLADYLAAHPAATLVHGRFLAEQVLGTLVDELGQSRPARAWLMEATQALSSFGDHSVRDDLTTWLFGAQKPIFYA
jgi:hypothetical protein